MVSHGALALSPVCARDAHELASVLGMQSLEREHLGTRLRECQLECAQLRRRVLDAEAELATAHSTTAQAKEHFGLHASRHGLALTAQLEQSETQRAALENDLQRLERLLWERDQEIVQLRSAANGLETNQLQGDLELVGLSVSQAAATLHARSLGAGVLQLVNSMHAGQEIPDQSSTFPGLAGTADSQGWRLEEVSAQLDAARAEQESLHEKHIQCAAEASRLETVEATLAVKLQTVEANLRAKQQILHGHDERSLYEAALLREHCVGLRRTLHGGVRATAGLPTESGITGNLGSTGTLGSLGRLGSARRQVAALLEATPGLVSALRARGRCVYSREVPEDHVDMQVHGMLKDRARLPRVQGPAQPSIVFRLGPGDYLVDEKRVRVVSGVGQLLLAIDQQGHQHELNDIL